MLTKAVLSTAQQFVDPDGLTLDLMMTSSDKLMGSSLLHAAGDVFGAAHPFWHPEWDNVMHTHVITCAVVLALAGVLCSAAGIGGGGIYVSALMVAGMLTPRDAVPLSKAVVFMGASITLYMNIKKVLNSIQRPNEPCLINFEVCRLVVPMALLGTLLGVLLNTITPDSIIVSILTVTLVFMTVVVCQRGYQQYQKEKLEMAGVVPDSAGPPELGGRPPVDQDKKGIMHFDKCSQHDGQSMASMRDVAASFVVLLIVIFGGIVRFLALECQMEKLGSFPKQHGRGCTDPILMLFFGGRMGQWMSTSRTATLTEAFTISVPVTACLILSYLAIRRATMAGWGGKEIIAFQSMGLVTGCLAGLVGIGGGLIFSPFFLMVGMDPASAVATSSTCIIFTSSSTTMQYIFTYRIIMSLALVYGTVNLFASYIGTKLVHRLQEMARPSYITFIVAAGVGISTILTIDKFVSMLRHPQVNLLQFNIWN